jgi:hypothetical protein
MARSIDDQHDELRMRIGNMVNLEKFLSVREYETLDLPGLMIGYGSQFDEIEVALGNVEMAGDSLSEPHLLEIVFNEMLLCGSGNWGECFQAQAVEDWYAEASRQSAIKVFDRSLANQKISRYKELGVFTLNGGTRSSKRFLMS